MPTSNSARRGGRLGVASACASGLALAILVTGCGPTTPEEASSDAAIASAQALQGTLEALQATGVNVPVPAIETLTVLYGQDGGIACINAESAFITGFNAGHFGSASGRRPGMLDPAAVAYDVAVLSTYCPQTLENYKATVEGWATGGTLPGS
ncbi:MAG: hypothetical protein F2793_05505 [Actinobacteria bacterium]|uniref:Unannotated protein n=1 Tax=freshwater metagenome TaxID=449393 RepID=A0A6J7E6G7_9ZZZZ|nr:hypothetical protein [Actinomycetota bacterium]